MADDAEKRLRRACMDFRVDGTYNNRNAGGKGSFENVDEADITVHEDCGAVKAAAKILAGEDLGLSPEALKRFEETFVKYFRGKGFENAVKPDGTYDEKILNEMYSFNRDLQEQLAIEAGIPKERVKVRLIDVPRDLHSDTVTVLIGNSNKTDSEVLQAAGTRQGESYLIREETVKDAIDSVELAVILMEKEDIRLVAASLSDKPAVEELGERRFMKREGVKVQEFMLNGNPKRVRAHA
jgi:hypothetical protein